MLVTFGAAPAVSSVNNVQSWYAVHWTAEGMFQHASGQVNT